MLDTAATGKWRRQPYCALRRSNRSLLCLRHLQLAERRAGLRDCFIAEEFLLTADCPRRHVHTAHSSRARGPALRRLVNRQLLDQWLPKHWSLVQLRRCSTFSGMSLRTGSRSSRARSNVIWIHVRLLVASIRLQSPRFPSMPSRAGTARLMVALRTSVQKRARRQAS